MDLGIGEFAGGGDSIAGTGGADYGVGARFSPHISSTYICQDAPGIVGVGGSCAAQYITQHPLEEAEVRRMVGVCSRGGHILIPTCTKFVMSFLSLD